jgi:exodeoxyribonuclease X
MKPLLEANWAVFDTETSGDDPTKHSPVEIGLVLTSATATIAAAQTLVNPGHPITNGAKAVHHLLDEDVQDAPALRDALKTVIAPAVAGHVLDCYVAHYAKFDSAMLPMLNKAPWLCTYRLAKKLYPELPHHGNQFLRYELGLVVPEAKGLPAHRAMADAWVTAALLRHLLAEVARRADAHWPQDLEGLVALTSQPFLNPICSFPKHKDKPWAEVAKKDSQYMVWLLQPKDGQKPLDDDTRFSILHFLAEAGVKV